MHGCELRIESNIIKGLRIIDSRDGRKGIEGKGTRWMGRDWEDWNGGFGGFILGLGLKIRFSICRMARKWKKGYV